MSFAKPPTLDHAVHTAKQSRLEGIETKLGNDELTLISELGEMTLYQRRIQVWEDGADRIDDITGWGFSDQKVVTQMDEQGARSSCEKCQKPGLGIFHRFVES